MNIANAVARVENLEFLSDVVPRTMTMKQYRQKNPKQPIAAIPEAGAENGFLKGQGTLDGHVGSASNGKAAVEVEREMPASEGAEDEEMQDE